MLPYFSIDTETTGLNPDQAQVIEFAAVFDDGTDKPLNSLPAFRRLLRWPVYFGDAFALQMNAALLKAICDKDNPDVIPGETLGAEFMGFIAACGLQTTDRITAAGKNFASFDLQFLKRLPGFNDGGVKFRHRFIDPAMLYWEADSDLQLPDSQICRERAGLFGPVAHTALADALDIVQEVRHAAKRRAFRLVVGE